MSALEEALGLEPGPDDLPEPSANGDGPDSRFRPYDLAAVMRRGVAEPRRLEGLLYPGKLHSIAGPPESGKTILSLWLAWAVMQRGRTVMYVDEEAGPDSIASILLGFGADEALIGRRLVYLPFQCGTWDGADLADLDGIVAATRPALAIWDSLGALLAVADQDENTARDVTRFWTRVLMPLARNHRTAILATDHDAKSTTDTAYARGSGAKLANVDVMFKTQVLRPFSRLQSGLVQLTVSKDRPGWLHRNWNVKVSPDPLALKLVKSAPPALAGYGLPRGAEALARVLSTEPLTARQLVDRNVQIGDGRGMRADTARGYLNMLTERGMADRVDQGPGRDALWMLPASEAGPVPPPDEPS